MHPTSNFVPVKWMYDAMYQNGINGILVSAPTETSGYQDRHHKKGQRDTIIVIPDSVRDQSRVDIIYWFHGLTGFKEKTFKTRLGPQYGWLLNEKMIPAILVVTELPWSWFTTTRWKRQGKVFRKFDEFLSYTEEVEMVIMTHLPTKTNLSFSRIIIGHSAGGSAIASAAKYGGLCKARPTGVVFSDSTYGKWFDKSWKGCLKKYTSVAKARIMVLGQSFGPPWRNYSRWQKKNREESKRVLSYRLPLPWTHGRIGNNAIPFFYGRFNNGKYENIYEK